MSFRNLKRLSGSRRISIPTDEEGMTGRECPNPSCLGYFKVKFGTGLTGENLPCYCPYCGHKEGHDHFYTQDQIKYARSILMNEVSSALQKDMKDWDRELRRNTRNSFIKLSASYKGQRKPIHRYEEKALETKVVCNVCTLEYTVYGIFAFCPDCGTFNSHQILRKNLDLAQKELDLAKEVSDPDLKEYLINDALENSVSAFDGFGRATCAAKADKATDPNKAKETSFQNISKAKDTVLNLFGIDFVSPLPQSEWDFICKCFQKRHLLAHKMGVVDNHYIQQTKDYSVAEGHKVKVQSSEVEQLILLLDQIGSYLHSI